MERNALVVRLRRGAAIVIAAVIVGTIAAWLTHGEFHASVTIMTVGVPLAIVLFLVGAAMQARRDVRTAGNFVVRCSIVAFLALPATLAISRVVVAVDLWLAKRYLAAQVIPQIEQARAARGRYPHDVPLGDHGDGPWLLRRFSYATDGRTYSLGVMDPGVCGRYVWYSSATRQWHEEYDPCYY